MTGDPIDPLGMGALHPARIEVEAYPFSGVIETLLTDHDVEQYSTAMEAFQVTGRAVLGGDRAPLMEAVRAGDLIEIMVTPSGDDPWPTIRYLISTVDASDPSAS